MKNFIVTGLIGLFACCVFGQEKACISANEIILGRNYISDADIKAKKYVFPESIYRWYVDDSAKTMALQLRGTKEYGTDSIGKVSLLNGTGDILLFDLQSGKVRWKKPVDYSGPEIYHYDRMILKSDDYLTSCVNFENGEELWNSYKTISYVNSAKGIGVGNRRSSSGSFTNAVDGVNLKNGESIWRRKINRDYNLNEILPLNDSVVLVSANGLHAMNLRTGKGWDYNAHTGKKDHTNTVLTNVFNIILGIILGQSEFEFATGHDLITDLVSNTLVDSTGIYMADRNSIVRIDKTGKVLWKSHIPVGMVSHSSLFFKDSLVCMVNEGTASINYETVKYGKAFIAAYLKNNGKKVFLTKAGYKKEQILSYQIQQDTLFLLSMNRVLKYSLADGSELYEQTFKTDSVGELIQFGNVDMFFNSDSATISPILSGSNSVVVHTGKNQFLVLDNLLNIKYIIPDNEVYYCSLKSKGNRFINIGNTTLVIDKNNNPVAELDISGNTLLLGNKLFEVQGKNFVEIDLNQLVGY
ncbi:MAG: PQQ-binding-like beta-propeller repeat protein [Paludibacter sp.]|nr:PQQ-binding-like beta-propeller repeat protein [Paludibacter sp.]